MGSASFFVNRYSCLESRLVHHHAEPCLPLLMGGHVAVSPSVQLDVSSCPPRGTLQMFNNTGTN